MNPPPPRRAFRLALTSVGLLAGVHLDAQEARFELPKLTVTTVRDLPPPEDWLYARIEGFEVLSNASPRATQQILRDFQHFSFALNLIWPGMRPTSSAGASLIICGRQEKFEEFLPASLRTAERTTTSFHRRSRDQATIVLDHQTKVLNLSGVEDPTGVAVPVPDPEAEPPEATINQGLAVDAHQQLYREYLRFLFTGRTVPQPAWLTEGLSQLFMNMTVSESEISIGRVEDPNEVTERGAAGPAEDRDFNAMLARRALLPMTELFSPTADSAVAQRPLNSVWAKQCYAFVHWGLYGDFGRNKQAFATFVVRLEREPLTESLFVQCFKQDYAKMLLTLRTHIETTRFQFEGVRPGKGEKISFPADPEVRPASEAEVGRLKGAALTLAGYPTEARVVLLNAYRRGEREPGLLAALGLAELGAGETERARKFLEVAFAAKALRPLAHVALARLRLDEALARPEVGGQLSAGQVAQVLEPLRLARSQPPALPETYELIGAAWNVSAAPPPAAHLALLQEGLQLFPRDENLRAQYQKLSVGRLAPK